MQIPKILPFTKINLTPRTPSFCSSSPIEDSFSLDEHKKVKKVIIQDMEGRDIEASIVEKVSSNPDATCNQKDFLFYIHGKQVAHATVQDNFGRDLRLGELYSEEPEMRKYKGIGTKLLECAVLESIKRGYEGRVSVQASHSAYSPLAFYYKNNFVVEKSKDNSLENNLEIFNAPIDYAIKTNTYVGDILPVYRQSAYMNLDENGAKAFLEGRRLYEERYFKPLKRTSIKGDEFASYLIQSPYEKEYFLAIFNESAKRNKLVNVTPLFLKETPEGEKYFDIKETDNSLSVWRNKEVKQFTRENIEALSPDLL